MTAVEAAQQQQQEQVGPDGAAGTLFDVLYANPSRPPVAEADWVALVHSVAAGDERALHALYERANRIVFTLIVRITANRETAEELTVDVFHDVWRRASGYDPANGTVVGWIMNQARSRAIDRVRFDNRRKRTAPENHEAIAVTADAGARLETEQQSRALRASLALLNPDERRAIEAAFFSGLTYAEVAARFDLPLGTVKTRIRSGLHKLRSTLT